MLPFGLCASFLTKGLWVAGKELQDVIALSRSSSVCYVTVGMGTSFLADRLWRRREGVAGRDLPLKELIGLPPLPFGMCAFFLTRCLG